MQRSGANVLIFSVALVPIMALQNFDSAEVQFFRREAHQSSTPRGKFYRREARVSTAKSHGTVMSKGITGQEASGDALMHIMSESQTGDSKSVLICMTGQLRTFGYTAAYKSMLQNVVFPLSTEASVETRFILSYNDGESDPTRRIIPFFNNSRIVSAIKEFNPTSVTVMEESSCAAYNHIGNGTASSPCYEIGGWLQLAWVNLCFDEGRQAGQNRFTHYMRMRPDSFFASKLPSLRTFPTNVVSTWIKSDAKGNDQWFLFADQMYDSWWATQISKQISSGSGLKGCCPDYEIWPSGQVQQRHDVDGCLLRSLKSIACWGADLEGRKVQNGKRGGFSKSAAKWQTKEDHASQKADFAELVNLLLHSSLPHFQWIPHFKLMIQGQECRCDQSIFGDESGMSDAILSSE